MDEFTWIIGAIAVVLVIAFCIIIACFFLVGSSVPTHNISIVNNCAFAVNTFVSNNIETLNEGFIQPGQRRTIRATPGTAVVVYGSKNSNVSSTVGLTKTMLSLAGEGYSGPFLVTNGKQILTGGDGNNAKSDRYAVILRDGVNINMTIHGTGSAAGCAGPAWHYDITQTGPHACPAALQLLSDGPTGDYIACLPPCQALCPNATGGFDPECGKYCCRDIGICGTEGGCQATWQPQDYYTIFGDACPNCLITNCDTPNFTCRSPSHTNLNSYEIIFCPNITPAPVNIIKSPTEDVTWR